MRFALVCLALTLSLALSPASAQEPWSTYRGNPQRTGNSDGQAGPATPKLLWVMKTREHFVASAVPQKDRLYISGLGAFNVAHFYCLSNDPKSQSRTLWTKTTPYLKLPTVSSPALSGDKLVFGDGMHQTDGAVLHCLTQKEGLPLWQLPVPGKLVHLEGSPTIASGKVFIGGGAAGVLCVDLNSVTLEGKELGLAGIQKIQAQRWQELLAKYEEQKKKDPDFAVPPNEDQLPRANPKRLWQQGAEKWHVDAPVTVVGDNVLVGSAYLDLEKVGDRALYCLDASTGSIRWRQALPLNPWGGPSVVGKTIVVGGSSIGYYPKQLKGARGMVAAYDLDTGKPLWNKKLTGGVVSSVSLTDDLAIATATDGKVRAFSLKDGLKRWIYDNKTPYFAPPAVAGGVVYVGDLAGVVTAIDLGKGQARWTFDIRKQPDLGPGMIYGGPVVHDGRLYVATCNLEGPSAGQPTVVLCLGEQ